MKLRATASPLSALALMLSAVWISAAGASLSEVPLVVHGKIVKVGLGGGYQLFSGTLHLKLVSMQQPAQVIDLDVPLRPTGTNGEFSYRTEIDQETEPAADQLATTLIVGSSPIFYAIQSATVDGHPASLLDPGQPAQFSTQFASRGEELRLDFKTDIPTPDTDGDGIPDWWEQRYGFDPANGADAGADADGDRWNNRREFQASTNPLVANRAPVLQDSLLIVTAGGSSGLYLPIADADTAPENLRLTLLDAGDGLTWRRSGETQQAGDTFTYKDVLDGSIGMEVSAPFIKDTVRLRLEDLTTEGVEPQELTVVVEAFSPTLRWVADPTLWLDAGPLPQGAAVGEWTDGSAYRHDGYQPYPEARPVAEGPGRLAFNGSRFLYVDDRGDRLGEFTAFIAFELGGESSDSQTLFCSEDLEIGIGGPDSGVHSRSLTVIQDGRAINGPVVDPGVPMQLTLESDAGASALRVPGLGRFGSAAGDHQPLSTFTTVGARQEFSSDQAARFFQGSLREVLFYSRPLTPGNQHLIEDYQLSRWQRVRLWNYRSATIPVTITGAQGVRNSLNGGDSNDSLTGADQGDLLRGGAGGNRLTGKGGADRFLFSKTGGNDTITDFSAGAGDVIDLTDVFDGKTGLPSRYVKFTTLVTRTPDNVPRVDTRLELIYDGAGSTANQTITLEGVGLGLSDLPRLVGEGTLQLGGPRYDSVISLAVSPPDPASPDGPRQLTVSRTGTADAAILVPLGLGGTARVDVDYRIAGASGTGSVRRVPLARGATRAVFDLIPATGNNAPPVTVSLTPLPVPQISDGGATLNLNLRGNPALPVLAVQTIQHIHPQLGRNGLAHIYRTGGLDQALDVPMTATGTLLGGVHVQALPTSVHFAPGQVTSPVAVTPIGLPPAGDELPSLRLSLTPDPIRYQLGSPATATVLWVSQGGEEAAVSFATWRQRHFPGNTNTGLGFLDSDHDGKANLLEYLDGSDPTRADNTIPDFSIARVDYGYEVRWASVRALTDVRVDPQESTGLASWAVSPIAGNEKLTPLPDGRIRHAYRFDTDPATRFFRIAPVPLPPTP
jgi:hypothetical protein